MEALSIFVAGTTAMLGPPFLELSDMFSASSSAMTVVKLNSVPSTSGRFSSSQAATRPSTSFTSENRKRTIEQLWGEYFADPSQWWDNRQGKENVRYPDFKHKKTHEGLWLNGKYNPPWVEAELAALLPGQVQFNTSLWNKKLAMHVKAGKYERTMEVFQEMQKLGMEADTFSFVPVLKACANLRVLEDGKNVHSQIIESGCESDIRVGSCLVDMYAKCGNIEIARKVFDKMPEKNVVAWSALIRGYVKCGQGRTALGLFQQMQLEGVEPNNVTFVAALNACASVTALKEGRRIHEKILEKGFDSDLFVASSLIDMYAKCRQIDAAQNVFDKMLTRNVVTWNTMIMGYVRCGQGAKALELSRQMEAEGVDPVPGTYVGMVNACASVANIAEGRRVHKWIIHSACESDLFVGNSLIDMYAKCGSIDDAYSVFQKMPIRDAVSWNSMILGFARSGQGYNALDLFQQMHKEGLKPNYGTLAGLLNACGTAGALEEGRRVHEKILQRYGGTDEFVGSSLVDMYSKCGSLVDAERVFNKMSKRDVVAWTAMIQGYVKCGQAQKALELLQQMEREGVVPNPVTFVGLLNACASPAALDEGKRIHQ